VQRGGKSYIPSRCLELCPSPFLSLSPSKLSLRIAPHILQVTPQVRDLFGLITRYKPQVTQLDTPLMPFLPEYIPALGEIDEFIKVRDSFVLY
jgi:hypothetical protein